MRKHLLAWASLIGFALFPAIAFAQVGQGTQTWWNGSRGDAATLVSSFAGAVNHTQAAGTLTITPPSGQYVYFTFLQVGQCQDGTASISGIQLNFTSTNLSGWVRETSFLSAATITTNAGTNLCAYVGGPLSFPLRSAAAGTAVTIVPPAQTAHVSFPSEAHYYFAP